MLKLKKIKFYSVLRGHMTQTERLDYLLKYLLAENPVSAIPEEYQAKKHLLRCLVNMRPPAPVSEKFSSIQDEWLQNETTAITTLDELQPLAPNLYLWQGDITKLKTDAIVNAANTAMLGCFIPGHNCIDNIIHTQAGVQLRLECAQIMAGGEAATGEAIITKGWNLPAKHVIHVAGPRVAAAPTPNDCDLLAKAYSSCLQLAHENKLESIAFCCISTGVFNFPNAEAAAIAIATVQNFLETVNPELKVVFNVFKDLDHAIYKNALSQYSNGYQEA